MWMPVKGFLELPGSIKHHQSSHTVHPMQNCDHLWLMMVECASPQHYLPGSWPSGPWEYGNTPEHTALHRSSIPARRRSILKQATMSHHFTKTDSILLEKSIMNNEAGRSAKLEIVLILYIAFPKLYYLAPIHVFVFIWINFIFLFLCFVQTLGTQNWMCIDYFSWSHHELVNLVVICCSLSLFQWQWEGWRRNDWMVEPTKDFFPVSKRLNY